VIVMDMLACRWLQLVWRRPEVSLPPPIRPVLIPATTEHPRGWKGDVLRQAWQVYGGRYPGVVVLDGDVAIEPDSVLAMDLAIRSAPEDVWTAPVRAWASPIRDHYAWDLGDAPQVVRDAIAGIAALAPDALWDGQRLTLRPRAVGSWVHRVREPGGIRWGRPDDKSVDLWGLGCTYLPNRLLERVDRIRAWDAVEYPIDDLVLSLVAQAQPPIPAHLVPECRVLHMHWTADTLADLLLQEATVHAG